jgi:shikimate kinase
MLDGTNVYLIGMMGVGKSTLGKLLAERLRYRFMDTDNLVEACSGQTVPEIFAGSGEAAFRTIEHQVLAEVSAYTRLVVATGGGIVTNLDNWAHLRTGIVIWLDVAIAQIYDRLNSSRQVRPLLLTPDPLLTLTNIHEQRYKLYAQADICFRIDNCDAPSLVCDRLVEAIFQKIEPNRLKFKSIRNS